MGGQKTQSLQVSSGESRPRVGQSLKQASDNPKDSEDFPFLADDPSHILPVCKYCHAEQSLLLQMEGCLAKL